MLLNLDILAAYLPESWPTKKYGKIQKSMCLSRPLLYEPELTPTDGALYLVETENLPDFPPSASCNFLCIGRRVPKAWISSGLSLLQISEAPGLYQVYNYIQQIFDHFDSWEQQLRDELEKDADFDLQKIFLLFSDFFHRALSVVDSNLQPLFASQYDSQKGAYLIPASGPMSIEYNERIKEVCSLERVIREPYQTAVESPGRAYCKNLYLSEQFCGCISIAESPHPFQPWELSIYAHFFRYFEKAYFKYLRAYGHRENAALSALRKALNGHTPGKDDLKLLHLDPGDVWLCFELCECQNERTLPVDYMYATLNASFPQMVYAVLHQEKIVGILRTREQTPYSQPLLKSFGDTVSRMGYCAGLSNPFTQLTQLQDYLRQAVYALEQIHATTERLILFRDHALSCMLDSCLNDFPLDSLLSTGIRQLLEHDRRKSSEYFQTLDLFLQNEASITRTAEALFIHRSSLLKRLDKIYRILGSTLTQPDERLYLRICIQLLKKQSSRS